MDLRARRSWNRTAGGRGLTIHDANVLHILALDGTVATIRRKPADDTFQLTVQAGDRQATRRIARDVAQDPESPEFARIVAKMKADLLGPRGGRSPH